jgi:hypothetical protein
MKFKLDKTEVETLRKDYSRYIQIDFVVKSQPFACHTDLNKDGGLAQSSTFYKMDDGKPDQFLFWTSRPVDDPNIAEYVFTEFFAKDGLSVDNSTALMPSATAPTKPHKKPKRRFVYQHVKKYDVSKQFSSDPVHLPVEYGILRLENDKDCLDGFGVEYLSSMQDGVVTPLGDLTDLNKPEKIKSINFQSFGLSKMAWLQAEGEFMRGDMMHQYTTVDRGVYYVEEEDEYTKDIVFQGSSIYGRYKMNTTTNEISYVDADCDYED